MIFDNPNCGGTPPDEFALRRASKTAYFGDGKTYSYKRVETVSHLEADAGETKLQWYGEKHWIDEWYEVEDDEAEVLEQIFQKTFAES